EVRVPADQPSLQAAVDAAVSGGRICLDPGTLVGTTTVDAKPLWIEGASTVLDGSGAGPVLAVTGTAGLTLRGVVVTGGDAVQGAGIAVSTSTVTLEDVSIEQNTCTGACQGTGLRTYASTVTLLDVTLADNTAVGLGNDVVQGAGVHFDATVVTADGVTLIGNTADADTWVDGGAWSHRGGTAVVRDLVATGNRAASGSQPRGSALRVTQASLDLTGALITDNTVEGGVNAGGAVALLSSGTTTLRNVLVAHNQTLAAGQTSYGSALYVFGHTVHVESSTISGNSTDAATTWGSAIQLFTGSALDLRNTDVSGNTGVATNGVIRAEQSTFTATYSNLFPDDVVGATSPVGTDGNLSVDPGWTVDWQPGPALVDAGDPAVLDVDGTRADIGHRGGPDAPP
ncbi:MAG: right-handed parallel beta-helix repeat-containing protein, partial [Myxococcales bacterium]|nr:right-handed parallel beta-helix repeat-containing protein [Myxococcales bacterium]